MQSSHELDSNAFRRGTKRILQDLTNLRISDDRMDNKKMRPEVEKKMAQAEENTYKAEMFSKVITTAFEDDIQSPHLYPCDLEKMRKDGHLFSRDYIEEVAKSLAQNEENCEELFPDPHYFPLQSDIRPRMRTILFTWLTEVHVKYNMKKDVVLWAAFQICDRYLSKVDVHRKELQLMGCAALWIASKYHDIHPPLANEFVNISDNAFSKNDLFAMEARICIVLNYQFTIPNACQYLDRYTDIALDSITEAKVKNRVKWLAKYAMERFHLHIQALEYCPSLLAAGALYAALKLTSNDWPNECATCSGYSDLNFLRTTGNNRLNLFEIYKRCILDFDSVLHRAVVDKYKSTDRGSVSTLRSKKLPLKGRRIVAFRKTSNTMENLY